MQTHQRNLLLKRVKAGFSLLELLVAMAIMAILTTVALPSYKKYLIQSKIASTIALADPIKAQAILSMQQRNAWPAMIQYVPNHRYVQKINGYACNSNTNFVINILLANSGELGGAANQYITVWLTNKNGSITAGCGGHGGTGFGFPSTYSYLLPNSCNGTGPADSSC